MSLCASVLLHIIAEQLLHCKSSSQLYTCCCAAHVRNITERVLRVGPWLPLSACYFAAGNISCEVSVVNTGSVRIEHVTVHGPDSSCAIPGKIQPGQNISAQCVVHKAVTQALFDAREANEGSTSTQLSLAVNVSAQSSVPDMAVISSVPADTFDGLSLPVHRNMTVTTSVDKTVIDLTGRKRCHAHDLIHSTRARCCSWYCITQIAKCITAVLWLICWPVSRFGQLFGIPRLAPKMAADLKPPPACLVFLLEICS